MKRAPILCNDGTLISVQASSGHYCSPKSDDARCYGSVEVQVISDAESYNDTDNTIGYMSALTLFALIETHGGIQAGELPPLNFGGHHIVKARMFEIAEAGEALYRKQQKAKEESE